MRCEVESDQFAEFLKKAATWHSEGISSWGEQRLLRGRVGVRNVSKERSWTCGCLSQKPQGSGAHSVTSFPVGKCTYILHWNSRHLSLSPENVTSRGRLADITSHGTRRYWLHYMNKILAFINSTLQRRTIPFDLKFMCKRSVGLGSEERDVVGIASHVSTIYALVPEILLGLRWDPGTTRELGSLNVLRCSDCFRKGRLYMR